MSEDVRKRLADVSIPRAPFSLLVLLASLAGCASPPSVAPDRPRAPRATTAGDVDSALETHFHTWRGTPHRWGGLSRSGVDCSGFVYVTFRDVFGLRLPRDTRGQSRVGRGISRRDLREGDLVFFRIGADKRHVGIYVGDGEFIHASSSRGVMRSSLRLPYWRDAYWKSIRVVTY